ncbi:DUF5714 domain-containing protein [Methanorbis furvi]
MNEDDRTGCLVCRSPLIKMQEEKVMECAICRKKFTDFISCINGHYVCCECAEHPGHAVIKNVCTQTQSKNPLSIAVVMMDNPLIGMHTDEHHSLVAASLLAAYKNSGGDVDLEPAVTEAISRGSTVPYGICAYAGTSGGAVSAGIFYSIIAHTSPLSVKEWGNGNLLVSSCLAKIGEAGGPRCCKRCTFFALETAVKYVRENLDITMEMPEKIRCGYVSKNPDCNKTLCPYYVE